MNQRIKRIRVYAGLSQDEFAAKLGYSSRGKITNIELGKTTPDEAFIRLVANTFGINYEWILTGEGEMLRPVTKTEEIARYMGRILADEDADFQRRIISAMSQIPPEVWPEIERFVRRLTEDGEGKKDT